AGGSVDVVDLPQAGIKGNSHMVMMDKNNAEVAALIQKWLEGKGLAHKPRTVAGRKQGNMHGTKILEEADRLMTVCNSCRYCEGLCAVFPAMQMRRAFSG